MLPPREEPRQEEPGLQEGPPHAVSDLLAVLCAGSAGAGFGVHDLALEGVPLDGRGAPKTLVERARRVRRAKKATKRIPAKRGKRATKRIPTGEKNARRVNEKTQTEGNKTDDKDSRPRNKADKVDNNKEEELEERQQQILSPDSAAEVVEAEVEDIKTPHDTGMRAADKASIIATREQGMFQTFIQTSS